MTYYWYHISLFTILLKSTGCYDDEKNLTLSNNIIVQKKKITDK